MLKWINGKNKDIVLVQETHSVTDTERSWLSDWGGRILFNHGSTNSLGTAILIKNRNIKVNNFRIVLQGRVSLLEFTHESQDYCLVNVYAPNVDNTDYLENLLYETYGRDKNDFIILAGDWNTVINNDLDKVGGNQAHSNKKCQNLLNTAMSELGLHDPFRLHNESERKYTHFNKKCKTATRLDFFLVDNNVINLPLCTSSISHGFRSDHSFVDLTLKGSKITHGRGYWKLNNSLLEKEEYCNNVESIINDTVSESFDSWGGLWDVIKFKVKDYSIRYGKQNKKDTNEKKTSVENEISNLKENIKSQAPNSQLLNNLYEELNVAQQQLNAIQSEEIKGLIARSRARWVEEGERSTKYFMGLEKAAQKKKTISKLVTESREILTSQEDISNHVVDFYQTLFSSRHPDSKSIDDYLTSSRLDSIDESLSEELDSSISEEELDIVVKALKSNKSPGWDGLTSEFYNKFWPAAKPILINVINESVDRKMLPPSLRIGVITIIPKPKPPPELNYIKNWRPITLLNTDYKIIVHVIKNRILKAIPHIISKSQSGFQSGRSTNDNLILMYLVLEHFNNNPGDEGLLLQVDYEKAFDSVEHEFLFRTMCDMGFGEKLIDLVKLAFHGCLSYANVNGYLSAPIYISRGLHQGSPLSPVLFLITAQVFTKNLINNEYVQGFSVDNVSLLQSLFADDTDLFLSANEQTVNEVFGELETFGAHSGCKFNVGKTHCIPLGKARLNTSLLTSLRHHYGEGFIAESGLFSALGLEFDSNNLQLAIHSNYSKRLQKATDIAKMWKMRDMTIYGRITLIKTFLLSQFVYLIVPLPRTDPATIKSINSLIYKFLWGGGCEKVKRDLVDQPKDRGGLDMVNFENFTISLKVKLIFKLLDQNFDHPWKRIITMQLTYPDHPKICIEVGAAKAGRGFTNDLLRSYQDWKARVSQVKNKTINECVWGNAVVTGRGTNTLWNNVLIGRRVMYLTDFIDTEGNLLSYDEFRYKHNIILSSFSTNEYVSIKLSLRRYNNHINSLKSLKNIDPTINLSLFFGDSDPTPTNIVTKSIRHAMLLSCDPYSSHQLNFWLNQCQLSNSSVKIEWGGIFTSLYKISNNFKIIQHQYKIFMKIATSRYSRHKMKIASSPHCCFCGPDTLETLDHIYLKCPKTLAFQKALSDFVTGNLDPGYNSTILLHITYNYHIAAVNFLNLVSNWYIGRKFQSGKELFWDEYRKYAKIFLTGEKPIIKTVLDPIL